VQPDLGLDQFLPEQLVLIVMPPNLLSPEKNLLDICLISPSALTRFTH
jgi:hypothetical protein